MIAVTVLMLVLGAVLVERSSADTRIASLDGLGGPANGPSVDASVSDGDGRFVAFVSYASNLVTDDTNGVADVFVRDLLMGRTERVSVGAAGRQANGPSTGRPAISAAGRFVAFVSDASDLVSGDRNGRADVFVRDRGIGKTQRISVDRWGGDANLASASADISADGRFVSFASAATDLAAGDTNGFEDVFVRDRDAGLTSLASADRWGGPSNGDSTVPDLSPDGRAVAFDSVATDLTAAGNWAHGAFVRDLTTSTTKLAGGPTFVVTDPVVSDNDQVAYVISGVPTQVITSWNPFTSVLWLTADADGDSFSPGVARGRARSSSRAPRRPSRRSMPRARSFGAGVSHEWSARPPMGRARTARAAPRPSAPTAIRSRSTRRRRTSFLGT